jgi:hypothetical protein
MKSVRVIGVGLVLGGALMALGGVQFFQWWMHDAVLNTYALAVQTLFPDSPAVKSLPLITPLVFGLMCLGAGLFLSATVYSFIDDIFCSMLAAVTDVLFRGPVLLYQGGSAIWTRRQRGEVV